MKQKIYKFCVHFIEKYALILLGFLIIAIYFWLRFFRPRTSKVLPLDLTVLKFFTTLYICLIFFYIVISLLFPRKSSNILIEEAIKFVFIPIMEFDKYLKVNKYAKPIYAKITTIYWSKLDFLIIQTQIFYIIFWVFPRLVLLLAFYVDVFIFHKFHYKYMVVLFGILLFINRYFKYSLKKAKEDMIKKYSSEIDHILTKYEPYIHPSELEPDYDPDDPDNADWPPNMALPFETYINYYVDAKVYEDRIIKNKMHFPTGKLRNALWIKYLGFTKPDLYSAGDPEDLYFKDVPKNYINIFGNKVPDNYYFAHEMIYAKTDAYIKKAIENTLEVALLYEFYNNTSNKDLHIKRIKLFAYINYFICWTYVLIISLPTLDIVELMNVLIRTWITSLEPFSDTVMHEVNLPN